MLVPFKESFVRYEEGDLIGLLCAILSLTPLYAAIFYLTVILLRRDIQTAAVLLGQCISIVVSAILKNIFTQQRPSGQTDLSDYGMPSSHTLFTFYMGTMFLLQIRSIPSTKVHSLLNILYQLICLSIMFGVGFSRVYLNYHYVEQVVVGAVVGSVIGFIWFYLIQSKIAKNFFKYLCDTELFKFLLVRDYSSVEYSCYDEYRWYLQYKQALREKTS